MPFQPHVNTRDLTRPSQQSFPLISTSYLSAPVWRGATHFENYFTKAQLAVRYHMRFTISSFLIFHYYFMFPTRIFRRCCLTTQSDGSLMANIRVGNSLGRAARGVWPGFTVPSEGAAGDFCQRQPLLAGYFPGTRNCAQHFI